MPPRNVLLDPGAPIAHYTGADQPGSLTFGFVDDDGASWLVGCGHVLGPQWVSSPGDPIVSGVSVGTLVGCDDLEAAALNTSDVALVAAEGGVTFNAAWPDDGAHVLARPYAEAVPPYRIYGRVNSGIACDPAPIAASLWLALPDGGAAGYAEQFGLVHPLGDVFVKPGDSGAPVRDAEDYLVGMVIGFVEYGKKAICTPWEAVEAAYLAKLPGD